MKTIKRTLASYWILVFALSFTAFTVIASSNPCCNGVEYDPATHKCCEDTTKIPIAQECCGTQGFDPNGYGCCNNGGTKTVAASGSECCDLGGTRTIYSAGAKVCCDGESSPHIPEDTNITIAPPDDNTNTGISGSYSANETDIVGIGASEFWTKYQFTVISGDLKNITGDITYTADGPEDGEDCGTDHQEPSKAIPGNNQLAFSGSVGFSASGPSISVTLNSVYTPSGSTVPFPLEQKTDVRDKIWHRMFKKEKQAKNAKFEGTIRRYKKTEWASGATETTDDHTQAYQAPGEQLSGFFGDKEHTNWILKFEHTWCCKGEDNIGFSPE